MATADAIFLCRYYFGGYCGDYEQPINDNHTECKRQIKDYIEKNTATIYLKLQMKSALTIVLTKHVKKLSPKPLLLFLKVEISKMQ